LAELLEFARVTVERGRGGDKRRGGVDLSHTRVFWAAKFETHLNEYLALTC